MFTGAHISFDFWIPLLVQKLRRCGESKIRWFCLVVELHWKGFATNRAMTSNLYALLAWIQFTLCCPDVGLAKISLSGVKFCNLKFFRVKVWNLECLGVLWRKTTFKLFLLYLVLKVYIWAILCLHSEWAAADHSGWLQQRLTLKSL